MDRKQIKKLWRAAWDIHQRLASKQACHSLELPDDEWQSCQQGLERLARLYVTGQQRSLRWIEPDVSRELRFLVAQLNALATNVARVCSPPQSATAADIYRDLAALEAEFEEVELDLEKKRLTVTTEALYVADQDLGPFQIELHLKSFSERGLRYEVTALDSDEEYPHPHVAGSSLCEGEASELIATALDQGRIFDFFVTVRQVLRNYDPHGAFDGFRSDDTVACTDCGYRAGPDERSWCSSCDGDVCDECSRICETCTNTRCHGCLITCPTCEEYTCTACKKKCPSCDEFHCKGCLTDGECESCREEETVLPSESADVLPSSRAEPAILTLLVGEAAVPA